MSTASLDEKKEKERHARVRHPPLVLLPVLPVLPGTLGVVPRVAVEEHSAVEDGVPVGNERVRTGRESPDEALNPVGNVVCEGGHELVREGRGRKREEEGRRKGTRKRTRLPEVLPATVEQELTTSSLERLGVLELRVGPLREEVTLDVGSRLDSLEVRLLRHRGVHTARRGILSVGSERDEGEGGRRRTFPEQS